MVFCRIHFSKKKLAAFAAAIVIYAVLILLKVPCIFSLIFKIPCPGCGMTRAFLNLLQGNFVVAFRYHPMVYFMPLLVFLIWQNGRIFCKAKYNYLLYAFYLLGFSGCYALRLAGLLPLV